MTLPQELKPAYQKKGGNYCLELNKLGFFKKSQRLYLANAYTPSW